MLLIHILYHRNVDIIKTHEKGWWNGVCWDISWDHYTMFRPNSYSEGNLFINF